MRRYHSDDDTLTVPKSVITATEDYQRKSDKVQNFIDECLMKTGEQNVSAKSVYEEYEKWCSSNGYGTENKQNFLDELRTKGLLSKTGTVNGQTVKNVLKGFSLIDTTHIEPLPFE